MTVVRVRIDMSALTEDAKAHIRDRVLSGEISREEAQAEVRSLMQIWKVYG